MLEPGQPAPEFTLKNQDGDDVSLSDFAGHRVVVYFYPRADTQGCTREACSFRDNWDAFESRGIIVLGISDDPVADIAKFKTKYELPFDLLSDEGGSVAIEYDSYGEKNMFGRTFDGIFRNTYIVDPDGTIEYVFEGVSPDEHAEEILDALNDH